MTIQEFIDEVSNLGKTGKKSVRGWLTSIAGTRTKYNCPIAVVIKKLRNVNTHSCLGSKEFKLIGLSKRDGERIMNAADLRFTKNNRLRKRLFEAVGLEYEVGK